MQIFLILYKNQVIICINIYVCDIKTRALFLLLKKMLHFYIVFINLHLFLVKKHNNSLGINII